jgi:hypothetical protein
LAGTRPRIVEAFVRQLGKRPLLIKARGIYYSFDVQGYLDVTSAAEAMAIALDPPREHQARHVIDLGLRLSDRRWKREHMWKPNRDMLRQITDDVTGAKRVKLVGS